MSACSFAHMFAHFDAHARVHCRYYITKKKKIIKSIYTHSFSFSLLFVDELYICVWARRFINHQIENIKKKESENRRCQELLFDFMNERDDRQRKWRQKSHTHSWNEFLEKCNDSIRAWWKIAEQIRTMKSEKESTKTVPAKISRSVWHTHVLIMPSTLATSQPRTHSI